MREPSLAMPRLVSILLVEDNPALAELVAVALDEDDVEVAHAHTGAEALTVLEAAPRRPGLVLLDLDLPDMRGLDVLDRIRAADPTRALPVVVLSASEEEEDVVQAATRGANSYVVKPAEFPEFRATVRQVVAYWTRLHRSPAAEERA